MSRNWATISSVLSSAHVEAGVLDDWCRRWFQTFSREGQEMPKRLFSVRCILAARRTRGVGPPTVGAHPVARAGEKPGSGGVRATKLHQPCNPCDHYLH